MTEPSSEQARPIPTVFYIDSNFKCHAEPGEGRREMQSIFFTGRESILSAYRFVPQDESWTRSDGTVFLGRMITLAGD